MGARQTRSPDWPPASARHRPDDGLDFQPAQHLFDPPVDEVPGAHVLRLLLAPDDVGVDIRFQHPAQRLCRERIDLLQPHDGDVLDVLRPPFLQQIVIHLAGADHDAAHLSGGAISSISGMTNWNRLPSAMSPSDDTASLCRSSDFGVNTISGLRKLRCNWRRSAWK